MSRSSRQTVQLMDRMNIKLDRKGKCGGQVDLHMHSWFSDGLFGPEELAIAANFLNLQAVALADHHTLAGTEEFRVACGKFNIQAVPCAEVTTKSHDNRKMDVLLYYPTYTSRALVSSLDAIRSGVNTKIQLILENLRAGGIKLWEQETLAQYFPQGLRSPHHILEMLHRSQQLKKLQRLMDQKGISGFDSGRMFGASLTALSTFQVSINYPKIRDLLLMAHEDGAVPIWAHPWKWASDKNLESLKEGKLLGPEGLMGFEMPSNPLDRWNTAFLLSLLDAFRKAGIGPIITIGNDFHGGWSDMGGLNEGSTIQLDQEEFSHNEVLPRLQAAKVDKSIIVTK